MSGELPIPEMRPFAMSLLVIATGDTRTLPESLDVVRNAALRYCIELAGATPGLATRGVGSFGGWLDRTTPNEDFFLFCGRLLDAIDRRVRGRHNGLVRVPGDEPSSYDHAALLALGQTLCQTAGVARGKFPPITQCLRNIAAASPRSLQHSLIANYLGNLLIDYFDASQVRAQFASLPANTEETLRTDEAKDLARAVFAAIGGGDEPADAAAIQKELRGIIGRVWIAEKALDD